MTPWRTAITKTLVSLLSVSLTLAVIELHPTRPAHAVELIIQGPNFNEPDLRKALFDAARIYGKAGCGDLSLAELTAQNALRANVPANLLAALISIESSCNPLAISNKGAVGLTQVNVKVQADKFAQFRTINLFNPEESMRVGADILAANIKQYGLHSGVAHYDGIGPKADAYEVKVLALAGVK